MSENTVIQKKDDFIMLPTSDFCFKELMQNSKVRKGIISALLGISPEEFFNDKNENPYKTNELLSIVELLNEDEVEHISSVMKDIVKRSKGD